MTVRKDKLACHNLHASKAMSNIKLLPPILRISNVFLFITLLSCAVNCIDDFLDYTWIGELRVNVSTDTIHRGEEYQTYRRNVTQLIFFTR